VLAERSSERREREEKGAPLFSFSRSYDFSSPLVSPHPPPPTAQIIEYAFHRLAAVHSGGAVFMSPSAAFLAAAGGAAAVAAPLGLAGAPLLLLPVNDNDDVGRAAGGSHWCEIEGRGRGEGRGYIGWRVLVVSFSHPSFLLTLQLSPPTPCPPRSLLAYAASTRSFRHYDSHGDSNDRPARALAAALAPFVAGGGGAGGGGAPALTFTAASPPQQTNGADCGVHVIVNAGAVAGAGGEGWGAADAAVAGAAGAVGRERARLRAEIIGGEGGEM